MEKATTMGCYIQLYMHLLYLQQIQISFLIFVLDEQPHKLHEYNKNH